MLQDVEQVSKSGGMVVHLLSLPLFGFHVSCLSSWKTQSIYPDIQIRLIFVCIIPWDISGTQSA